MRRSGRDALDGVAARVERRFEERDDIGGVDVLFLSRILLDGVARSPLDVRRKSSLSRPAS